MKMFNKNSKRENNIKITALMLDYYAGKCSLDDVRDATTSCEENLRHLRVIKQLQDKVIECLEATIKSQNEALCAMTVDNALEKFAKNILEKTPINWRDFEREQMELYINKELSSE